MASLSHAFRSVDTTRVTDLAFARALLSEYTPCDDAQSSFRERMLDFIDDHPHDAHERACLLGHLTASCLLLDHTEERALLTHHAKLDRWLQLGGHLDGDANLPGCAWREATEESGIQGIELAPTPIDLDIHTIPAREDEPEHAHLDVRFLGRAPAGAREIVSDESLELGWFSPDELEGLHTDHSVVRLFQLAFD